MLLNICGGGVAGLYTGPAMPCAMAMPLASNHQVAATMIVFTALFTISPLLVSMRHRAAGSPGDRTVTAPEFRCLRGCLRRTYRQSALCDHLHSAVHWDV